VSGAAHLPAPRLTDAEPRGSTSDSLLTRGFTVDMLGGLARNGLVRAHRETVRAGGRTIEVIRVRITDAGRRAVAA
jgi:hypothetical protein